MAVFFQIEVLLSLKNVWLPQIFFLEGNVQGNLLSSAFSA